MTTPGEGLPVTPEALAAAQAGEAAPVEPNFGELPPARSLPVALEQAVVVQRHLAEESIVHTAGASPLDAVARMTGRAERQHQPAAGTVVCNSAAEKLAVIGQLAEHLGRVQHSAVSHVRAAQRLLLVVPNSDDGMRLFTTEQHFLLEKIAPRRTTGMPYHYNFRASGAPDIAVVEVQKLDQAIAGVKVPAEDYGLVVYDSGSEQPDPNTLAIIRNSLPVNCVNIVTRPPDAEPYSKSRPRPPLRVIHEATLAESIRSGSMNGVELYTFRTIQHRTSGAGKQGEATLQNEEAYNDLVVEGVLSLVQQGRRVAVYCQVGSEAAHANVLVERLRQEQIEVGYDEEAGVAVCRPVVAETVSGKYKKMRENKDALRGFNRGMVDVLATSSSLEEGGGVYADALVIATRIRDRDTLAKLLAHSVAPNPDCPTTVILEFLALMEGDRRRTYSVREFFGETIIRQGLTIGGYLDITRAQRYAPLAPYELTETLGSEAATLNGKLLRQATLSHATPQSMEPPHRQRPFDEICTAYVRQGYTQLYIRQYLAAAGFPTAYRIEEQGGQRQYVAYATDGAEAYLAAHPPAPFPQPGEKQAHEIYGVLDIPPHAIRRAESRVAAESAMRTVLGSKGGHEARFFTVGGMRAVVTELAHPAIADRTDRTLENANHALGCGTPFIQRTLARAGQQAELKLKWTTDEQLDFARYLNEDQWQLVEQAMQSVPEAGSDDIAVADVAAAAQTSEQLLLARLPVSTAVRIREMHAPGRTEVNRYMPGAVARGILKHEPQVQAEQRAPWQEVVDPPAQGRSATPAGERPYIGAGRLALPLSALIAPDASPPPVAPPEPPAAPPQRHARPMWTPTPPQPPREQPVVVSVDTTRGPEKQPHNTPTHREDAPGEWRPSATMNTNSFISTTDTLTPQQIAERLNIRFQQIVDAIGRLEPGDYTGQLTPDATYTGNTLLLIREQLVGIPLGYMALLFDVNPERAETFMRSNGYAPFNDNRYSPGAFALLRRNIDRVKAAEPGATS